MEDDETSSRLGALSATGTSLMIGSVVDMAGVIRCKAVPLDRASTFHRSGMGASPSWAVFCIDDALAFTSSIGTTGDLRLRADLAAARDLGGGLAWAPAEIFTQDGEPSPLCPRGLLRRTTADLEARGLSALVGCELEFVLTQPDGSPVGGRGWNAYGVSGLLDVEGMLHALLDDCQHAGLAVEQLHAEYGNGQYEMALGPTDPIAAADHVVQARIIVGRVARRWGLGVSFSPQPFVDGAGNGAHQHVSFTDAGESLFSGGTGPYGITEAGGAVIAALVRDLPELVGVFAGSLLSPQRLQPDHWSGAFACWGLENREAAIRFCAATRGNPHGASVEVKCVDPSANPYLSTAVILAMAREGIAEALPLPKEVPDNPAKHDRAKAAEYGAVPLADDQRTIIEALGSSARARSILGDDILDALLAVRRHEVATYGDADAAELAERFRFAWSA